MIDAPNPDCHDLLQDIGTELMGYPIPIICNSRTCGHVWIATNLVGGPPGASVTIHNGTVSPCPACGGVGRLVGGRYDNLGGVLFNKSDLDVVLNALHILHQKNQSGATQDEIAQEISIRYPFLESLKRFLPSNPTELNTYLLTILAIATLVSNCTNQSNNDIAAPQPASVNIYVQQELSEAIAKTHSAQGIAQPTDRQQPQQQEPANQ